MKAADRFDHYLADLSEGLDHTDRHAGLRGYCTSLMRLAGFRHHAALSIAADGFLMAQRLLPTNLCL